MDRQSDRVARFVGLRFSLLLFVLLLVAADPGDGTATVGGVLPRPRVEGIELWTNTFDFATPGALPWWLTTLSLLDQALPFLCWGIGAYVLGEVIRSVQASQPFDQRNPRRIVTLAGLVAVGGTGLGLFHYLVSSLLLARVELPTRLDVSAYLDIRPISLVITGVLLVVAAAFRQGRKLTQDVEGLV